MNGLTTTRQEPPSQEFRPPYEAELLSAEVAKMLGLVAPITMSADQQAIWIASAVDALRDIRATEVQEVSMQVRRAVTRPSQIVPEIAKLVAERRAEQSKRWQRQREDDAERRLPRPKPHISDRDRRTFKAEDWAELNLWLESQGSKVRYRSDGTKHE